MDPALLNYLQYLQSQRQAQPAAQPVNNQVMPAPQPMAPPPAPQPSYNPFDAGIQRAISSARQSLGMTREQGDRALRSSMLSFAGNIGQQPRERGFLNNLGSVSRALIPAINTYDQQEDIALHENNALANQILQHQAAEQARQAEEEERNWRRGMAEQQMAEQRRRYDLTNDLAREKSLSQTDNEQKNPIWKEQAKNNAVHLIPDIANKYLKTEEMLPSVAELKSLLSTSKLTGASKFAGIKRYIAEQIGKDEDILTAKNLGQFYIEWMNDNSKGVLSDNDVKMFKAGFADIEKNPKAAVAALERLEGKLRNKQEIYTTQLELYDQDAGANLNSINILNRKVNKSNNKFFRSDPQVQLTGNIVPEMSLNQDGYISPYNLDQSPITNQELASSQDINNFIQSRDGTKTRMIDPNTHEHVYVANEDVQQALEEGYKGVSQ